MMNDLSRVTRGPDDAAGRVGSSAQYARARSATPGAGSQGSASRQYSQADAREILGVAGFGGHNDAFGIAAKQSEHRDHFIVVDETGVSPNAFIGHVSLLWKPCLELMNGPDTPDANLTPGLPFPFVAPQLAMFMLDGPGVFVTSAFGGWLSEPDQDRLDSMGIYANRAREAVRAAFAAYHLAVGVVGVGYLEHVAQEKEAQQGYEAAYEAACVKHNAYRNAIPLEQYRIQLELAKNEVAPLRDQHELAKTRSASAQSLWRKAMVKELLRSSTLQTDSHSQSEVVADAAASGGVEPAKAGPVVIESASDTVEPDKAGPVDMRWVMKKAALIR